MKNFSARQRTVLDVLRLLFFGVVGFLLSFEDLYGAAIPAWGELAINLTVLLLLEIAIRVFLIEHDLRQKYLLVPHDARDGRNLELLTAFSDLLMNAADSYHGPKISMIRTCIEKQLATLASDLNDSGSVRFYVGDLAADSIQDLFGEGVTRSDHIVATCFTEMEDFWYLEPVGGEFMKINVGLLNGDRERMKRLFFVKDDYWDHSELRKRELIRLLSHMGCDCRIITRRRMEEHQLPYADMFIVRNGQNISFGFEWKPTPGGDISSVLLTLREDKLKRLDGDFKKLWKHAESVPELWAKQYPLYLPKTAEAARFYLEKLYDYKRVKPTNVASYLRTSLPHPDSVARYWDGMRGTLIRPAAEAVAWFKSQLPAATNPGGRPAKVGILGSTPELRRLAADHFPHSTVHVFDLSHLMVEAMRILAQEGPAGQPALREKVVIQNWLTLNLDPGGLGTFDCIMGVDVLNMVNLTNMEHLLKVVADLLKDGGVFITQAITKPPRHESSKQYRGLDKSLIRAYEQLHQQVGNGITIEEMFAALCLGRIGDEDSVYVGGLVAEMETWEDSFDKERPLSRRYAMCNTTLFVPERPQLETLMRKWFDIAGQFSHTKVPQVTFRDYMFCYKLLKRGRFR